MVLINIRVVLVDLLIRIDLELYVPFVTTDKKIEKLLIIKFLNAIYVHMVDILIYYNKFVKTLKRNVFQLNPYDPCVSNRLINNK